MNIFNISKILIGVLIIGVILISGCATNEQSNFEAPIKLNFNCPETEIIKEEVILGNAVGITYDKVDGDWIKSYEIYTESSKNCFIKYNQKGEIINQVCE